jgi:hypothetical protein
MQMAVYSVLFSASPAPQLKEALHKLTTRKIFLHVLLNEFGSKLPLVLNKCSEIRMLRATFESPNNE